MLGAHFDDIKLSVLISTHSLAQGRTTADDEPRPRLLNFFLQAVNCFLPPLAMARYPVGLPK